MFPVCSALRTRPANASESGVRTSARLVPHYNAAHGVVTDLEKHLETLKWNLWHGNVFHALQRVDDLEDGLDAMDENPPNKKKLMKAIQEFGSYIRANQAFIPNYGDCYRLTRPYRRRLSNLWIIRAPAAGH